jgi:hypothetical protein
VNGEDVTKRGEFFSEFQRALNNVPEHSKHAATPAFFEKVVDKFISLFDGVPIEKKSIHPALKIPP